MPVTVVAMTTVVSPPPVLLIEKLGEADREENNIPIVDVLK